jgi:hypothetical protein
MSQEKVYFFFDESGKTGFANSNRNPLDFGLIAGIATPERNTVKLESKLKIIFSKINTQGLKKMHATEIFVNGKNSEIRKQLFKLILEEPELLIIYEGVYQKGVAYYNNENIKKIMDTNKPKNSKVKIPVNNKKESLYSNMLIGIIIKLDEMCRLENSSELVMFSDNMDKKIFKRAKKLLDYLRENEHVKIISGFDKGSNKVVKKTLTTKVEGLDINVKYIKSIEIAEKNFPNLIIASDIICNSIYRFLKCQINTEASIPRLNAEVTFEHFILKNKLPFLYDNYIMDNLYSPLVKRTNL